jgi:transcriptional regulator with XRE-family HTH domain
MSEIYKNYGKAIKAIRCMRGISQIELSQKANLDSSYISRIEAGGRIPSAKTLEIIAKILNVPISLIVLLASKATKQVKNRADLASIGEMLLGILQETSNAK